MAINKPQLYRCTHNTSKVAAVLPFSSVKDAVSLFREKAEMKKVKMAEKCRANAAESRQVIEELAERFRNAEKANKRAIVGFEKIQNNVTQQREVDAASVRCEMRPEVQDGEANYVMWESPVNVTREQHMTATTEVESAKKELAASFAKESGTRQEAEGCLIPAEFNGSSNIMGTGLADVVGNERSSSCFCEEHVIAVQELESKLVVAIEELLTLQHDLEVAQKAEEKVRKATSEAFANLGQARIELEEMHKIARAASALSLRTVELHKALENAASLEATMQTLETDLIHMRKELTEFREREATATAGVITLMTELTKTKSELKVVSPTEARYNKAIKGFLQTLQQSRAEADSASEAGADKVVRQKVSAGKGLHEAKDISNMKGDNMCALTCSVRTGDLSVQDTLEDANQAVKNQASLWRCNRSAGFADKIEDIQSSRFALSPSTTLGAVDQTSTEKKKKHLSHSLSTFLGKKSQSSTNGSPSSPLLVTTNNFQSRLMER